MAMKPSGKRPGLSASGPSKKRKLTLGVSTTQSHTGLKKYPVKAKERGSGKEKGKAKNRDTIPIPSLGDDGVDLSDQDFEALEEYGNAASFLNTLDQKGISRSKKETERLHRLIKPVKKAPVPDNLPSLLSDDDGEDFGSSDMDSLSTGHSEEEDASSDSYFSSSDVDSDTEMPYEREPRQQHLSWDLPQNNGIQRLPIKLADGSIHKTGENAFAAKNEDTDEESEEQDDNEPENSERTHVEDVSTGARFGRPAVLDILCNTSKKAKIRIAKQQIADICQDIVADPENSLGLLRRLRTFSMAGISTPSHPNPVKNDTIIRKLAILSQLAVYKDIIPGYRIRALTAKEKEEKVSQMVACTREWEQGLVVVYQSYLQILETELKSRSELAAVALRCMCILLTEVSHFNFRVNLIGCIIARLSKKSWDEFSDLCLNTLIEVFRTDLTGAASLEIVQLLNRMVKEKRFNIHPEVLSCLLHLRLKSELGVRASESMADKNSDSKSHSKRKAAARRAKGKSTDVPHLSKKTRKAFKEKKEIEKEFREAEAEVDKEERTVTQTETLKLLFVLYFRILKNPRPTPLLSAALHGISKFAHLVNIDFFKDLMKVLKGHISRDPTDEALADEIHNPSTTARDVRHCLLCIVTAFELLSGQGEALNIDLTDFISKLYAMIIPLSHMHDINIPPTSSRFSTIQSVTVQSIADILFRALNIVFSPRTFGATAPPWRSAAFAKRLLTASLHWPPDTALRTLDFVGGLVAKDPKLDALLSADDRTVDGIYRPDIDDPQLCHPFGSSFWELYVLKQNHWDTKVREEAQKLLSFSRS